MRAMATMTAAVLLAVHAIGAHSPETTRVQGPQGAGGPGRGAQAPPVDSRTVWAGELLIEPPTLINLGFEWLIEGDDNRNAAVAVSYRKTGETRLEAGAAAAAAAGRAHLQRCRSSTWCRRTCSPAASSIWSRTPPTKRGSC